MVDKGKVRAAIEEKLKGKSLSKNFKDSIAEKWAAVIEDEDSIADYIEDRLDILNEASAEADRRAVAAVNKHKAENGTQQQQQQQQSAQHQDDDDGEDTPKWAKKLFAANEATNKRLDAFENSNKAASIESKFKNDERLKGIPASLIKRSIPQSEEEYETAVEELVNDYRPIAEALKLADFGNDAPPGGGVVAPVAGGTSKPKVDPDVEKFAKKQNEKFVKP